jgi:PAS domain S-box-containing protein
MRERNNNSRPPRMFEMEEPAETVKRLKCCLNDLVSVMALPAIWTGRDRSVVAATLLDALVRMLRLDFAYLRLIDPAEASQDEWVRVADPRHPDLPALEVGRALEPYINHVAPVSGLLVPNPVGEGLVSIASLPLGLPDATGTFIAGSCRHDFPAEMERVVLQVATNQAAIRLQETQSADRQKRVSDELARRVAEQKEELTAANEALRLEVAERALSTKALAETEDRLQRMADNIPEVIWVLDLVPEERVIYTSPSFERVWGLSLEDLYRHPRLWTETIHPDDRERVADHFSRWIAGADVGYEDVEYRIVRPDGATRWIHEHGVLTVDDQGKPTRVSGISTDITDRRRAEQRLVAQNTVTQVLAEAATLEEATPKILQAVCECLVWDLGELWRIDRAAGVLRRVESWRKASV